MSFTQNLDATSIRLTKRERQVLGMMNQRMSSKENAVELCLSPRTVDDVRARLIKRFGLRRATDLLGKMRNLG
jgi:DNA-binding CsgD family transcriptional regulator